MVPVQPLLDKGTRKYPFFSSRKLNARKLKRKLKFIAKTPLRMTSPSFRRHYLFQQGYLWYC